MEKYFKALSANCTLDITLKELRNKSDGLSIPQLAGYLYPKQLTMEPTRVLAGEILELLCEDGHAKRDVENTYAITFKGRVFIAYGGYRWKLYKEFISATFQFLATWAIVAGTVVAGLYYWNHRNPCQ